MQEKPEGLIFTGHPETYNKHIEQLATDADLPRVGLHGLRHSFASLAYHVGMDERTCMELGGWSNPATMQKIYTHVAAKDKEKHKNALRKFFEDVGTPSDNSEENAHENAHDD